MGAVSPRMMLEKAEEEELQKLMPIKIVGHKIVQPWEIEAQSRIKDMEMSTPPTVKNKRSKSKLPGIQNLKSTNESAQQRKRIARKARNQEDLLLSGNRTEKINKIMEFYRPSSADRLKAIKRIVLKEEKTIGEINELCSWLLPRCPFLNNLEGEIRNDLVGTIAYRKYDVGEAVCNDDSCGVVLSGGVLARLVPRDKVIRSTIEVSEQYAKETHFALSEGDRMLSYLDSIEAPRGYILRQPEMKHEELAGPAVEDHANGSNKGLGCETSLANLKGGDGDSPNLVDAEDIFRFIDAKKNGFFGRKGLQDALLRLGIHLDHAAIDSIILEIDTEEIGEIGKTLFRAWFSQGNEFAEMMKDAYMHSLLGMDIFQVFDTDRSGGLDEDELHSALNKIGLDIEIDVVDDLIVQMCPEENGEVSAENFRQWFCNETEFTEKLKQAYLASFTANEIFRFVDEDGDGDIEENLKHAIQHFGIELEESQFESIMRDIDEDRNGGIFKEEFQRWFCQKNEFAKILEDAYISRAFKRESIDDSEKASRFQLIAQKLFYAIDFDKSGFIGRKTLHLGLHKLGIKMDQYTFNKLMNGIDPSGSDKIDLEQFFEWFSKQDVVAKKIENNYFRMLAKDIFEVVDADKSGDIARIELASTLKAFKIDDCRESVRAFMEEMDVDDTRDVNVNVFHSWLQKQSTLALRMEEGYRNYLYRKSPTYLLEQEGNVIFEAIDDDGSGEIDVDKLSLAVKKYQMTVSRKQAKRMFQEMSQNEKNAIDRAQFIVWYIKYGSFARDLRLAYLSHSSNEIFQVFDVDNSSGINLSKFYSGLNDVFRIETSLAQCKAILNAIGFSDNKTGEVYIDRFGSWLRNTRNEFVANLIVAFRDYKARHSPSYLNEELAARIYKGIDKSCAGQFNIHDLNSSLQDFGIELDEVGVADIMSGMLEFTNASEGSSSINEEQFVKWFTLAKVYASQSAIAVELKKGYLAALGNRIYEFLRTSGHVREDHVLDTDTMKLGLERLGAPYSKRYHNLRTLMREMDQDRDSFVDSKNFVSWFEQQSPFAIDIHDAFVELTRVQEAERVALALLFEKGRKFFRVLSGGENPLTSSSFNYAMLLIRFEIAGANSNVFQSIKESKSGDVTQSEFAEWFSYQGFTASQVYASFEKTLVALFKTIDTDQRNWINAENMRVFFSAVGSDVDEYEVDQMAEEMSLHTSDDKITLDAFVTWFKDAEDVTYGFLKSVLVQQLSSEALRVFSLFNAGGDSNIDSETLQTGCDLLDLKFSTAQVEMLFAEITEYVNILSENDTNFEKLSDENKTMKATDEELISDGDIDVEKFTSWYILQSDHARLLSRRLKEYTREKIAQQVFSLLDIDSKLMLSRSTLKNGMARLNVKLTSYKLDEILEEIENCAEAGGEGVITADMFQRWFSLDHDVCKELWVRASFVLSQDKPIALGEVIQKNESIAQNIFSAICINNKSSVSADDIKKAFVRFGIHQSDAELDRVITNICPGESKNIDEKTFIAWYHEYGPFIEILKTRYLNFNSAKTGIKLPSCEMRTSDLTRKKESPLSVSCQILEVMNVKAMDTINADILNIGLEHFDISMSQLEVKKLIRTIQVQYGLRGSGHDENIAVEIFSSWLEEQEHPVAIDLYKSQLRQNSIANSIFQRIDTTGDGAVSFEMFAYAFKTMNMGINTKSLKDLFELIGNSEASEVHLQSFQDWFKKQCPIATRLQVRYLLEMLDDQTNPGRTLTVGALVGPRWLSDIGDVDYATFRAISPTEVIYINRSAFDLRMLQQHQQRVEKIAMQTKECLPDLFEKWSRSRMNRLCDKARLLVLKDANEIVYEPNDPNTSVYFVLEGAMRLSTTVTTRHTIKIPSPDRRKLPTEVTKEATRRVTLRNVHRHSSFGETALAYYKPSHILHEKFCTHGAYSAEPHTTVLEICDKDAIDLLHASGTARVLLERHLKFDPEQVATKYAERKRSHRALKIALMDSSKDKTRRRIGERLRQEKLYKERSRATREQKRKELERRRNERVKVRGIHQSTSLPNLPVVSPIIETIDRKNNAGKQVTRHAILLSDNLPFQSTRQQLNFQKAKRWFQSTINGTRFNPKIRWEEDGTMTLTDTGDKKPKPFPKMKAESDV